MEGGPIGLDGDTVRDPVDPGYRPERERAPTRRPAMEGQNAQDPLSNIRTAYCKGAAQVSDVLYRLGIFCIGACQCRYTMTLARYNKPQHFFSGRLVRSLFDVHHPYL